MHTNTEAAAAVAVPPVKAPSKRFRDAVMISEGACNPSGIALSIVDACREARADGFSPATDPAVRLMVTQLAFVCKANSDTADWFDLLEACKGRGAS